ncbi:hypothetical protein DVH24_039337 [Malus domestica]|uniref:Uncharacterized protein n=1 Tax=Malus domestica TaxID=3750 RepID=A0A498HVM1_MALDO|nr:hypothetical protein DVH24_039337 [Malus domestica]
MASSSKSTKSPRITPYNLPPMKEESQTFVENHRDLLGQCRVWWESGHDIHATLPALSDPQRPCTKIYPWFLDLGFRFPLSDFLKTTFKPITCFELLNQFWYGAGLGTQEFRMLLIIMMGFDNHYYFLARPSPVWDSYIQDDRDWFKDILVVDKDWEGTINEVRVRALHSLNLEFNNELADIRLYRPELIHQPMRIPVAHHNWKWLFSPERIISPTEPFIFLGSTKRSCFLK